jgi:hypothetical protein
VWLLAIVYFAWAMFVLFRVSHDTLYPPNCHNCLSQWDAGTAPYTLLLHALMLICAVGTFRGRKLARLGLLLAATVFIMWSVFYETFWYITSIVKVERPQDLTSPSFWLSTSRLPLIFAIWLAFNFWYLYGRASQFFATPRPANT